VPHVSVLRDRQGLPAPRRNPAQEEGDDEEEDDDDDFVEEYLTSSRALQDSSFGRMLDADEDLDEDDEFYNLLDDVMEGVEEMGERERLRLRQRQLEVETARLKAECVALNVTDFDSDLPEVKSYCNKII
jgi:hypothetical protein